MSGHGGGETHGSKGGSIIEQAAGEIQHKVGEFQGLAKSSGLDAPRKIAGIIGEFWGAGSEGGGGGNSHHH